MSDLTTSRNGTPTPSPEHDDRPTAYVELPALLEDWVSQQIITADQAARIRARGTAAGTMVIEATPPPRQASLAVEALGYLGGVIILVSTVLITAQYWADLETAARLTIVGVAALGLLGAGAFVPQRLGDVGERLRSVLWLMATGAAAGFVGVFGADVLDLSGTDLGLLVAGGSAAVATALWSVHRLPLQQVAMMVALMVTAAVLIADQVPADDRTSESLPGLGVWAVAVVWFLLGWGGVLGPRQPVLVLAAIGAIVGTMTTVGADLGIVLALLTAVSLVAVAVLFRDLYLLAIGAVGCLQALPVAVSEWFPDTALVPYVLLVLGLVLVAAAIWTARHRRPAGATTRGHDFSVGRPVTAVISSCVVVAGALAVVLAVAVG